MKFTASEAVKHDMRLNGKPLDQIAIGVLAKHGVIATIGEGPKPARGKTPALFEFKSKPGLDFYTGNSLLDHIG